MPDFVTLTDGPTLPDVAVRLAVDLESRGYRLAANGEQLLVPKRSATTGDELSEKDRADIRKWKTHLLAVVSYCDRHND